MTLLTPRSRNFCSYWLPPLVWWGVILALSGDLGSAQNTSGILKWLLSWLPLSPAQFDLVHYYFRKTVGHFGNYGFVYFLWFRAFRGGLGLRPGRGFLGSITVCLVLALLDEGHQSMLSSRTGCLQDVALDLSGAATVAIILAIFWPSRDRTANNFSTPDPGP